MKKELISLLNTFVSFESTEEYPIQKMECIDWVQSAFFANSKHSIKRGAIKKSPYFYQKHPEEEWLWFAHMDVVPANTGMFSVTREGDKLIGRGVKDMKGAALPFLLCYRDLIAAGKDPKVSILLTSDEEVAGHSIPMLIAELGIGPPIAFTPDTGSSHGIVTEHKGVVWATLTAEGKGGHAAIPWESDNPVHTLSKAICALQSAFPAGSNDDWAITVTPTKLHGSDANNKIPDTASCGIDIRYPSSYSSEDEVIACVNANLPKSCTLSVKQFACPLYTDPNHAFIQRLKEQAEEITGTSVPVIREHGATDARYFSAVGIPAFLYGPEGGNLHGSSEWVSASSLVDHYHLYSKLLT